ncbi:MAG: L-lactate permease [Candidatus Promineifilaceae bacterium]|nr:L-lactate permease [Candidatus Promineifilaceae bacterium]
MFTLSLLEIALAATPILLVLYLMIGRNWDGSQAGPAGWLAAGAIALLFFGAGPLLLLVAFGRAVLLALYVLYIIWMALLLYNVVADAGAIDVIGRELPGLAPDRPAQALLLAWIFGSFLQGVSGFGVPAAVVAPLLAGLQFPPSVAAAVALLGHGWSVTFGSLGSSFLALMAATGLPGEQLASESAALLALACLGCGAGVLLVAGGWAALRRRLPFLLGLTVVMGAVQWAVAVAGLWTLAATAAALAGLVVSLLDFRFSLFDLGFLHRSKGRLSGEALARLDWSALGRAFVPYAILVVVILLGQLVLARPLDWLELNLDFPVVETALGWRTPAGPGRSISIFGHAGALLLYASALSFLWFRHTGVLLPDAGALHSASQYSGRAILGKTVRRSVKSTVGILALVAMAVTMQHAGMTQVLALALSANTGPLFPFLSPFIGALGAFVTGSNTNSNVVFGDLQQQTALALDLAVPLMLAAQTAGGAIGSVFAPAKVLVGASTVEGADDGEVLRLATLYGAAILLVLGVVVLGAALW